MNYLLDFGYVVLIEVIFYLIFSLFNLWYIVFFIVSNNKMLELEVNRCCYISDFFKLDSS